MKGLAIIIFLVVSVFSAGTAVHARIKSLPPKKSLAGSVGNLVWLDSDKDGIQDPGEPGVPGIEVIISDQSGWVLATTVTNTEGVYLFKQLDTVTVPKSYRVFFKLPGGYNFSPKTGVLADAGNSDVSPGSWKTDLFTLLPGDENMDIDAGLITLPLTVLPLHRLELHSFVNRDKVQLKWIAENELNTHLFNIQKSLDGISYATIGSVTATAQINTPTEYFFADDIQYSTTPVVYYRIMARDNENRAAYSNICQLKFSNDQAISVWPTVFNEAIRINYYSLTDGNVGTDICDHTGKVIWKKNFTIHRGYNLLAATGLDLLKPGLYYFNLREKASNKSFGQKIIKP